MTDFDPEAYLEAKLEKKDPDENGAASKKDVGNGSDRGRERSPRERRRRDSKSKSRSRSPDRRRRRRRHSSSSSDRDRTRDRRRRRSSSRDRDRRRRRRSYSSSPDRRSRSRSRSPRRDRRDYDRRDDRYRGSSYRDRRDRDRGDRRRGDRRDDRRDRRDRSPPPRRERDAPREREPPTKERSPPMSREERAMKEYEKSLRSVLVVNLSRKVVDRDVDEFFKNCGKVNSARLITDRHTGKSKGIAYVEFEDKNSVAQALLMSGTPLKGQVVMVQASQAEKNFVAEKESQGPTRLFVGGLHQGIGESDLQNIFSAFGPIEFIQVYEPQAGKIHKYGFIQYMSPDAAAAAVRELDGYDLAGQTIKVSLVQGQSKSSGGAMFNEYSNQISTLDDEDGGGGVTLNAASRAALMQKLGRGTAGNVPSAAPVPVAPAPTNGGLEKGTPCLPISSVTSGCVVVKNMFDYGEKDSELLQDVEEDVKEECDKHGGLQHVFVDRNSAGLVYVKFATSGSAQKAMAALNGRWYAGNMISCQFVQETAYRTRFNL